jgi:hypothetical protein
MGCLLGGLLAIDAVYVTISNGRLGQIGFIGYVYRLSTSRQGSDQE